MGRTSGLDGGLQPGELFGDYEIVALAGKGGMGVVYKAVHVRLQRLVALKLLRADLSSDPGFEDRFSREAQLAASVKHKNLVIVYDSGIEDDRFFLAMEWVEGEDLRSILDREARLDPATAVHIVHQTAEALEAVHATMVHRDVKPANILVNGVGEKPFAYLTDFGIARPTASGDPLTQPGMLLGTPGYLSPEQWSGRGVDRRADLYALGCVFFEAISGTPVFSTDRDSAVELENPHNTLPSLVPVLGSPYEPFDRFLAMALAIDPDRRHSSALEFANALEAAALECVSGISLRTEPDPPMRPGIQPSSITAVASEEHRHNGAAVNPRTAARTPHSKGTVNPITFITLASVVLIGAAVGILAAIGAFTRHNSLADDWHKPRNLQAGPLGSAPTAGADATGTDYVFWRGTNGTLWEKWKTGKTWNAPIRIRAAGRRLASQPAVAVHTDGEQDVFWMGTNGDLWEISYTNVWQKPRNLGAGPLGSAPTAGVDARGAVYVFWEGTNDTLWDEYNLSGTWNGPWNGPDPIRAAGRGLATQPAVAVHPNGQQDVFWKGTNGSLWEVSHTDSDTGWQHREDLRSGPLGSAPTAGIDATGAEYVLWQGTRGTLWRKWNVDGRWDKPRPVAAAHHGLGSQPPAIAVHAFGQQDVFWKGTNGDLWEISHTN